MPVSEALARTLVALRRARISKDRVAALAEALAASPDDTQRLSALSRLYSGYSDRLDGRAADPATLLAAARDGLSRARWLEGAEVLIVDDLELEPDEMEFVEALGACFPMRILRRALPPGLRIHSLRGRLAECGVHEVDWSDTPLSMAAPAEPPAALVRLREGLFEPPKPLAGTAARGAMDSQEDGVELVTAPGEAAEVRAIVRRLLREAARGVPFEEMGVVLPRPDTYLSLFTDLLTRLNVPHRLHPSLPLSCGRAARSLLLLFRCRGLERSAVMEFLTFAPVPYEKLLGTEVRAQPARWDQISREAGIVSGYSRWMVGLRAWAGAEREAGERDADRRERRERNAVDAEALLQTLEYLNGTLEGLAGEATWGEWVERLRTLVEIWLGTEPDKEKEAVLDVIAKLGGLGSITTRAPWSEVEQVVETRFEWKLLPLEEPKVGAVHVGSLDAMAGLTFRAVAIPGLVEGGYPGVFRPDPFLLDDERLMLRTPAGNPSQESPPRASDQRSSVSVLPRLSRRPAQLDLLFQDASAPVPSPGPSAGRERTTDLSHAAMSIALPTSQDHLLKARRLFHRAVSQATERLILSYPRADARSGRERLPSLFLAAAAATLAGRAVAGAELDRMLVEDDPLALPLEDAVDAGERDRFRMRRDDAAATAIASGSPFFKQSVLASKGRWWPMLTHYDGLVDKHGVLAAQLDPLQARHAISASRLATYARCGFQYLLQHVLHLQPALEPEERRRIDPLERGNLFHGVAEHFLRERRDRGELPVADSESARARLTEMAEKALTDLVEGSPPRFTLLWEREKRRFHRTMQAWLASEAGAAVRTTPAHFELSFGLGVKPDANEPHDPEPLEIALGDGRVLRVSGRIDRIDRRAEGGLVLRDYKTGRAPKDDGGVFRGGKQLQIPFYVLAAAKLFPGESVEGAFLDYVDGGRRVAFRPELVTGPKFKALLRELVDLVAKGVFVQEPTACDFCDFTAVCGPKGLLQRRQLYKRRDLTLLAYLRLRDIA